MKLKLERGIGFEVIAAAIRNGNCKVRNVRSENHPGQLCYRVRYRGKIWYAPYQETDKYIYLNTIIEVKKG